MFQAKVIQFNEVIISYDLCFHRITYTFKVLCRILFQRNKYVLIWKIYWAVYKHKSKHCISYLLTSSTTHPQPSDNALLSFYQERSEVQASSMSQFTHNLDNI